MSAWNPNGRDPEWTDSDGAERGAGAILWLFVCVCVIGLVAVLVVNLALIGAHG